MMHINMISWIVNNSIALPKLVRIATAWASKRTSGNLNFLQEERDKRFHI